MILNMKTLQMMDKETPKPKDETQEQSNPTNTVSDSHVGVSPFCAPSAEVWALRAKYNKEVDSV